MYWRSNWPGSWPILDRGLQMQIQIQKMSFKNTNHRSVSEHCFNPIKIIFKNVWKWKGKIYSFKTGENLHLIQFQVHSQMLSIAVFLVPRSNFRDQVWYGYPGGQGGGIGGNSLTEPKRLHAHTSCKDCFCIEKSDEGTLPVRRRFAFVHCQIRREALTAMFWPLLQYFGPCLFPNCSWKGCLEKEFPCEDVSLL